MLSLPKPLYVAARLVRRFLPSFVARRTISIEGVGTEHIVEVFTFYQERLSRIGEDVKGKTVLEVGSGVYGAGSLGFLAMGAGKILLGEPGFVPPAPERFRVHVQAVLNAAQGLGGVELGTESVFSLEDGQVVFNAEAVDVIASHAESLAVADGTVDVLVSNAALEHVRELEAAVAEMARCTKPGGVGVHRIDFRDHGFHRFPFDMLRYSRYAWERVLTTRTGLGGYQNRLRLGQVIGLFESHGFSILDVEKEQMSEELAAVKHLLHPDFCRLSDDDLATTGAAIAVRREHK